eukprot:scaffold10853_cov150-Skeletonema_marinoi.AAC.1
MRTIQPLATNNNNIGGSNVTYEEIHGTYDSQKQQNNMDWRLNNFWCVGWVYCGGEATQLVHHTTKALLFVQCSRLSVWEVER